MKNKKYLWLAALIPVAIKASETLRKNARIRDDVAVQIVQHLEMDTAPLDKFMSHEGVIARTVMLDRMLKQFIGKNNLPQCCSFSFRIA